MEIEAPPAPICKNHHHNNRWFSFWQVDLCHYDVKEGADDNDEVKVVPGVFDVLAKAEGGELDDKLEGEEGGEDEVHEVKKLSVRLRLEGDVESTWLFADVCDSMLIFVQMLIFVHMLIFVQMLIFVLMLIFVAVTVDVQ